MAVEIEGKMKVTSHDPIRERLQELNAELVADIFEQNTFFDTPDGKMRTSDQGLRVRLERHEKDGHAEERIVTTYKGPKSKGTELKTRKEVELQLSDGDAMAELYKCLGYEITLRFEKTRQRWKLDGCQIELDTLPKLGPFVEIEGPEAELVIALREKLGLGNEALLSDSYASMLSRYLDDQCAVTREMKFND